MTDKNKNFSADIFKQNPELLEEMQKHEAYIKDALDSITELENKVKALEDIAK